MNLFRLVPGLALVIGLVVFGAVACSGSGSDASADEDEVDARTPMATETRTATRMSTPTPTATPTPTPFAGPIARLKIPRFGVDAPIEELAINEKNELDTPKAENTAVGWYYIYDRPGWGGNAVFSAHVYYNNQPAPFVNLARAVEGDEVVVQMANGAEYVYRVISNTRYHRDTIPMGEIIWPSNRPPDKEWVTLITCGGQLDASGWEYLERDVIVAERVQ